jgi:hypothetical protein
MDPIILGQGDGQLLPHDYRGSPILNECEALCVTSRNAHLFCDGIIGTHDRCNGVVRMKKNSTTHHVMHCEYCGMRRRVPVSVCNYASLRDWFLVQQRQEKWDSEQGDREVTRRFLSRFRIDLDGDGA